MLLDITNRALSHTHQGNRRIISDDQIFQVKCYVQKSRVKQTRCDEDCNFTSKALSKR